MSVRAAVSTWVVLLLALIAAPALAKPPPADPEPFDSLATSSGVPWNPPHAMSRRRGWEHAALAPGQLLSLPLSVLGAATDRSLFYVESHPRLSSLLSSSSGTGGSHYAFSTSRLSGRTGLGGSLTLRHEVLHGPRTSTVSAEYAATLPRYNRTRLGWTGHPLFLQYAYDWRPQDRYYGMGNDSPEGTISDYANQSEIALAGLSWTTARKRVLSEPYSALVVWAGPRSIVTRNGREAGQVSFETRFPALGAELLNRRVENFRYGASLARDQRSGAPHWSRGWRALLSAERYATPVRAFALHSAADDGAHFTRLQAEAEAGVSFRRDPRTLRLLVRMTDLQVDANESRLLLSDLSTLGGRPGLEGFPIGRFHDRDLLLSRVTYVFPLERWLEVEAHAEWGAVYPDLWSDAKLTTLQRSQGFSLRLRDARMPRASAGLDFSHEAIRIGFTLGGSE